MGKYDNPSIKGLWSYISTDCIEETSTGDKKHVRISEVFRNKYI